MDDSSSITSLAQASPALVPSRSRFFDFLDLARPRMNFLVIITTSVGYYMAVHHSVQWVRLFHTLLATALTAAAASALNQWIEQRHDALMTRTASRPLPRRRITSLESLLFALPFAAAGLAYLAIAVNPLTASLGAITLLSYVLIYTPLKRVTSLNTIIGAVPGAIPALMGWTAATGAISPEGVSLFLILFVWQMPHFLAIAILHKDDYARAGFKMLPVIDANLAMTGRQIVLYTASLIPVTLFPFALQLVGGVYFVLAILLGLAFLGFAISAAANCRHAKARNLFIASILYLPLLLAMMMIDKL